MVSHSTFYSEISKKASKRIHFLEPQRGLCKQIFRCELDVALLPTIITAWLGMFGHGLVKSWKKTPLLLSAGLVGDNRIHSIGNIKGPYSPIPY